MLRRKKYGYFEITKEDPISLVVEIKKRVSFSDVDLMGIVWYGMYSKYFEEGATALGRKFGFSFKDLFIQNIKAPVVQFHVDYHNSLVMDEEFTIKSSLIWSEAARINTEYEIRKENNLIAITGYTVQMFVGKDNEVCLTNPEIFERFKNRWKAGEFSE